MNKRVTWLIALLIFIGTTLVVQAQQKQKGEVQSEISLVWGFAQGTFGDNLDRPIPGIVFFFGGRSPDLPLVLSTEIGLLNYGFDDHLELRFPGGANTPAVSVVNVETGSTILMTHLVARFVPFGGKIVPYIDGLIGFKYLSTNIGIESEAIFDDDNLITLVDEDRLLTSSTFDSFGVSYGVGAGIDIQVFSGSLGLRNPNSTISMHLGVRYLFSSEADYLAQNSIRPETGGIRFEQVESDTDMLIPKLGMRIRL